MLHSIGLPRDVAGVLVRSRQGGGGGETTECGTPSSPEACPPKGPQLLKHSRCLLAYGCRARDAERLQKPHLAVEVLGGPGISTPANPAE